MVSAICTVKAWFYGNCRGNREVGTIYSFKRKISRKFQIFFFSLKNITLYCRLICARTISVKSCVFSTVCELDQSHVALYCLSLHNQFWHIQMMKDVTEFSLVHFHSRNDVQKLNFNLYPEINRINNILCLWMLEDHSE